MYRLNHVIVYLTAFFLCLAFSFSDNASGARRKANSGRVIIPGSGAVNVFLNDTTEKIESQFGKSRRIESRFPSKKEIFRDVFRIKGGTRIYFDLVYYYKSLDIIVFFNDRRVTAVIGLSPGVTSDRIDLRGGMDSVLFHYGNDSLSVIRTGTHRIYQYPNRGIAFVDDNADDSIDMYMIFRPSR